MANLARTDSAEAPVSRDHPRSDKHPGKERGGWQGRERKKTESLAGESWAVLSTALTVQMGILDQRGAGTSQDHTARAGAEQDWDSDLSVTEASPWVLHSSFQNTAGPYCRYCLGFQLPLGM